MSLKSYLKTAAMYQQQYIEARLGKDWMTSGAAITPDGFAEQTCFLGTCYGLIRALF